MLRVIHDVCIGQIVDMIFIFVALSEVNIWYEVCLSFIKWDIHLNFNWVGGG